jgi:hypothetical protein
VVFLSRYGRRPFEYYWRTVDVEGVTPLYPGVQWDRYTPVLADRDIESTERAALRLERGYARIWVVLLWAGFGSVHEDAGPLKAAIDRTYQGVSERWFGPLLRVRLYVQSPQAI